MEVITEISVKFDTELCDSFDDVDISEEGIRSAVEEHIKDWLREHKLRRDDIDYKINMGEKDNEL